MFPRAVTYTFVIVAGIVGAYAGWRTYRYFVSSSAPEAELVGVVHGESYCGDIPCAIAGRDAYKVAEVSVWLDGQPLVYKHRIGRSQFEHPFSIPSKSLPNGQHTLKIEAINGTYARKNVAREYTFFIDNAPLQAAFVRPEADHKVFQGKTLHIQFQTNKELKNAVVKLMSHTYDCFPESPNSLIYECFIPISCEEAANEHPMSVELTDRVGNTMTLNNKMQVIIYPFKKQNLKVSSKKVEEEQEAGANNDELEKKLAELLLQSPKHKLWHGSFYAPIDIANVTTEFGTVRTTQEKGRYMHKGVDLVNTPKCVVWAPQDGVVIIKERYAFSGNTVAIDHGCGIFSLFFHLDSFSPINVGDKIKKGGPIGKMGMTGYATGYHLHWEMRINNVHVDPMQWIKPNF